MATTGIRNEWSVTDDQCGDKQAYSQNIFEIWNNFLSISKFGCCEMVKICLMYCSMGIFLKDETVFYNTVEIYSSVYYYELTTEFPYCPQNAHSVVLYLDSLFSLW